MIETAKLASFYSLLTKIEISLLAYFIINRTFDINTKLVS